MTPETLFARLIDDAGLFPPARKPMARAAADHRAARASAHAGMLGRFLCPVSRLAELGGEAADDWGIGAIFDGPDWREDLACVAAHAGRGRIRVLEVRLPADVELAARELAATPGAEVFFEVPAAGAPAAVRDIAALPEAVGAKLRCGGVEPQAFPPDEAVAAFIATARELALPFKLTAGLHHPFRTRDEAIGVLQHGFVNLLAATALDVDDLVAVVAEPDPAAFRVDAGGLRWRDTVAGPHAIARARSLFTAYGSCSFDEPVDDLIAHGCLED